MANLFVNLGRNLIREDGSGILAEAKEMFGADRKVFVLALQDDRLLDEVKLPEGVGVIEVEPNGSPTCYPATTAEDVFILNGGMTPQQAAMMVHMSIGCTVGRVVNMQRDGCVDLVSRSTH